MGKPLGTVKTESTRTGIGGKAEGKTQGREEGIRRVRKEGWKIWAWGGNCRAQE